MNRKQFENLESYAERERIFTILDVRDNSSHTLLYGYSSGKDDHQGNLTHHLYVLDGKLHFLKYTHRKEVLVHLTGEIPANEMLPQRRTYPESTDFQFAQLLAKENIEPRYTSFSDDRAAKLADRMFHGETHESIKQPSANATKLHYHCGAILKFIEEVILRDDNSGGLGYFRMSEEQKVDYEAQTRPLLVMMGSVDGGKQELEDGTLEKFAEVEKAVLKDFDLTSRLMPSWVSPEKLENSRKIFAEVRECMVNAGFPDFESPASA